MSCQAMRTFYVLTVKPCSAVLPHWLKVFRHCALTIFTGDLLGGFSWPHSLPRDGSCTAGELASNKKRTA